MVVLMSTSRSEFVVQRKIGSWLFRRDTYIRNSKESKDQCWFATRRNVFCAFRHYDHRSGCLPVECTFNYYGVITKSVSKFTPGHLAPQTYNTMKPKINDLTKFEELKTVLVERNVTPTAIATIERALAKGMVFKKPEDLTLLNMPAFDITVVGEVVDFATSTVVVENLKTIEYTFNPIGEEKFFFGYQLILTFINRNGFTVEQAYPIEDPRTVIVDLDLNDLFGLDLNDPLDTTKITLRVKSAQGKRAQIALAGGAPPSNEVIEIRIPALANTTIDVVVDALAQQPNPPIKGSYQIKGKLISNRSEAKLDGYQITVFAATADLPDGTADFSPVGFATTESNGYFVTSFLMFNNPDDINNVTAGKVSVAKDEFTNDFPIKLVRKTEGDGELTVVKSMLPDRLIVVINEDDEVEEECKDCGCTDLNFHEKKVLEEYSYYTVVRTTEPSIIADVLEEEEEIDLEDIYGVSARVPLSVFKQFHAIESKQIRPINFNGSIAPVAPGGPTTAGVNAIINSVPGTISKNGVNPAIAATFNKDLLNKLVVEHRVRKVIRGDDKPVFKGRTFLNQFNQIVWDKEAVVYQAASIAHGHLLQFKQEWIPDGYSIGDLVYSLPLAPGQKKQIAILDWERRESAANSQFLGYEETLNNSLVRDRDVNEVISATLTENIRGNSKASTGGIGFGFGSSVMGIIPGVGTFGSLLGISGGTSSSGSNASQNSHRQSTASSLQSISDRTVQAASVVRSQRSTVVQTVSQGERVQATAESVANYNHCHAITIQYFEVLRHFAVRTRLAGVQECLFVPLQMEPFDLEKCLRWRNTLEKHLYRRQLRAAFDAVARIQNEKESPFENYYDSIGFPRKNFAEQSIDFYSGELFMDFFFFNTNEEKIDDSIILFYSFFGISLDGFRDKKITDEELAQHVGPRAIEYLLDTFVIETDKGIDLKLDLTLISTFRQSATLQISVRQSSTTPLTVAREQIDAVKIKLDLNKLSPEQSQNLKQFQKKFMKIRLRSGNLRYRTANFAGTLFNGRIDNDIFAEGDGAFVSTLLSKDELRNPRGEDVDAANNLLHHLNENMEYYHKCIYFDMTPERRFMLLDGIIAPGKANGRSVASVVENRVIGIAGNSLIMPVAPGNQLDPTIDETFHLFAQYFEEEREPMRVSMPTKGIYAEAVMGKCNSCEEKDEGKFWRWEESPIPDSPTTQILPLDTGTRRADPGDLQPKDFPAPIVNIQNAPSLPDPSGLQGLLQLLGKGDAFRDLTGLNQNQLNALATFQKSLDTAATFGKEAAELAKAAAANKLIEDAKKSGTVSNEKAKQLAEKNINAAIPATQEETMDLAQKQIDLISKLEETGGITSEDAQTARKNIVENLTKRIDTGGTSAGDLGTLMEKASKFGTDVKKDGDAFEISGSSEKSAPLIIDVSITPTLRAFGPQTNLTGKTKLSVKPSKNSPPGAKLQWIIPAAAAGRYTITQQMKGNISEVEITGIQPGLTTIEIAMFDRGAIIASEAHVLSIPQFVTIREAGATPTLFDGVLTEFSLANRKNDIVSVAKQVCNELLRTSNVRTIWSVGPFTEAVPAHVPAANVTTVTIHGEPPPGVGALFGITNLPAGPTVFADRIDIFPGTVDNPATTDLNLDAVALMIDIKETGMTPTLEPFAVQVVGRLVGFIISHEIVHSLMGFDIPTGHNNPPIPGDMMNQGGDLVFLETTGFENTARVSPVDPNDFIDRGIGSIANLSAVNQGRMDLRFPVQPN